MIEQLKYMLYKVTYLNYPDFSTLFIFPNGQCKLQVGVALKPFAFEIKDIEQHKDRLTKAIGEELYLKVKELSVRYE